TVAHCNHIRLSIAYWTLGPDFCKNTPFAMQPSEVCVNGWSATKSLCARCLSHGIGVLIDLHAGPGGFGQDSHTGSTNGEADFWTSILNEDRATRCLIFIADEIARDPQLAGVIGLQICNEAIYNAPGMYGWYKDVVQTISKVRNDIPIYISDGWDIRRALNFSRMYNSVNEEATASCPVIVETHRYYCFDSEGTSRSPEQITERVGRNLWELNDSLSANVFDLKSAVAVYVGDYSMSLAPDTRSKTDAPLDRHEEVRRASGHAESKRWQEKAIGSAFWTLKRERQAGADWGFKEQVRDKSNLAPKWLFLSESEIREYVSVAEEVRGGLLGLAIQEHVEHWEKTMPQGQFEF
ncbi:MAG: Glucan 1,3-beta-glucosidase 3, partial [Watsoniomyces obsoletus]